MSQRIAILLSTAACAALLASCQTAPQVKHMDVNGARLPYVEQGVGAPVLFVHGAISDHRTWDRHRAALAAEGYRAIAYSQRYFGAEPWQQHWPKFGEPVHADDLVAFMRGLGAGPVHLVAWSYSGQVVLDAALRHPELVKSAFIYEPSVPSYVTDPAALKAIGEDAGVFGPTVQAVKAGDNAEAVRRLLDAVNDSQSAIDAWPKAAQTVAFDNARTLPAQMLNADKPPPISCEQLGSIKPPVAIVRGENARPFFRIIADTAAKCMPRAQKIIAPGGRHLWPGDDPRAFSAALVGFLKQPR